MMEFKDLERGKYYDGFVWRKGRQKGVDTCLFDGTVFVRNKPNYGELLVYSSEDNRPTPMVSFEPAKLSKDYGDEV